MDKLTSPRFRDLTWDQYPFLHPGRHPYLKILFQFFSKSTATNLKLRTGSLSCFP